MRVGLAQKTNFILAFGNSTLPQEHHLFHQQFGTCIFSIEQNFLCFCEKNYMTIGEVLQF